MVPSDSVQRYAAHAPDQTEAWRGCGDYGWFDHVKFGSGVARALAHRWIVSGGGHYETLDIPAIAASTEFTIAEVTQAITSMIVNGLAGTDGETVFLLSPSRRARDEEEAAVVAEEKRRRAAKVAARGGVVSRRTIPARVREFVFNRDGRACLHCLSTEDLSLDHIHPWSLGGPDTADNLQTLCRSCNSAKGDRT